MALQSPSRGLYIGKHLPTLGEGEYKPMLKKGDNVKERQRKRKENEERGKKMRRKEVKG